MWWKMLLAVLLVDAIASLIAWQVSPKFREWIKNIIN